MKTWNIEYSKSAEPDLEDIYRYIAESLSVPDIARRQTRRIVERISKLHAMPKRCPIYEREKWGTAGLRRMNADNFAVFYLADDARYAVTIVRILYSGRDIDEILK
jgi:toxin ParE1/3/4